VVVFSSGGIWLLLYLLVVVFARGGICGRGISNIKLVRMRIFIRNSSCSYGLAMHSITVRTQTSKQTHMHTQTQTNTDTHD